jgi:tetratricopeptide (TPR) repeat protein
VDPLRRYTRGQARRMLLGHYLLGKALLDECASTDARKELELVLAKNPAHAGAMIGLARVEETPEKRLSAARELAEKKMPGAGPAELADLQLLIGQSAQALGRTPEAIDAFQRAVNLDRRLIAAYVSLGESLLYEGKYAQALERLRAAGPGLEKSTAGKFGLGGALIATGNAKHRAGVREARRPKNAPTIRADPSGQASQLLHKSRRICPPPSKGIATPSSAIPNFCPPP